MFAAPDPATIVCVRLVTYLEIVLRSGLALFRSRGEQALVELALRQQLELYAAKVARPRIEPRDRGFWVILRRVCVRWADALVVVKPDTVVRWHREGFRLLLAGDL